MQLSELLTSADITPVSLTGDAALTKVTTDSRQAGPGACFIAVCGTGIDGHRFIAAAIDVEDNKVGTTASAQVRIVFKQFYDLRLVSAQRSRHCVSFTQITP